MQSNVISIENRKLSRKEREHRFRLNLVLDAAEEVFAEASYATASVEDIANRAEVSVGTLYNLFRSKEEIYMSVVSRAQQGFFEELTHRVQEARGPDQKILAAVSYYFEHFQRYGRQFRLYVSATNGFQWELKSKLVEEAQQSQIAFQKQLTTICQQGLDEGIFKQGVPAGLLAVNILGVPHAMLMTWLENESGPALVSFLPQALTVVARIVGTDQT
jgi:AcrR family transcriptional regulator